MLGVALSRALCPGLAVAWLPQVVSKELLRAWKNFLGVGNDLAHLVNTFQNFPLPFVSPHPFLPG